MIQFLIRGLLRDRHRSFFPVIIVTIGVFIVIWIHCFMVGISTDMVRSSARLDTGHVKIMSRAYEDISSQVPNDLALFNVNELIHKLEQEYPQLEWAPRIKFGGLLDFPDENGETLAQGPTFGFAVDLLSSTSKEKERLSLSESLVRGRLPENPGEILISDQFANVLDIKIGDTATLITSNSYGGMAVQNFTLVGTLTFGIAPMDKNTIIADISDIQYVLDMADGTGELLGFYPNLMYKKVEAEKIKGAFNDEYSDPNDEYSPIMVTLRDQNGLGQYLDMINQRLSIAVIVFVSVMSVVLWNAGLMSGLRRYGEFGVRLAIGESKEHVYKTLIYESISIGLAGSILGTLIGLGVSLYFQEVGWDISNMLKGSNMVFMNVMRAQITPTAFYIGFIPGLLATFIGSAISGIGIFKRETAQLFKELEA